MPPIRAELHISIIQDTVTQNLTVELSSQVEGHNVTKTTTAIGSTQIFARLQELVNNLVRTASGQMEIQAKKQRIKSHE